MGLGLLQLVAVFSISCSSSAFFPAAPRSMAGVMPPSFAIAAVASASWRIAFASSCFLAGEASSDSDSDSDS